MKNKKIIVILLVVIIFVILGDAFLVIKKHNFFHNSVEAIPEEKEIREYNCSTKSKKISFMNVMEYDFHNEYRFLVEENRIIYGELKEVLAFDNEEEYAFFLENDNVEVQFVRQEDKEHLQVLFSKSMILDTDENLLFQENYLSLLENKGFFCK